MSTLVAPPQTKLITGIELYEMGDIGPCELIDGRIVTMSPTGAEHGMIEFRLGGALQSFVLQQNKGWVMGGEVGVYTRRNPDRVRGGDIIFVSNIRSEKRPGQGFLEFAPDLIVEIMSPSDRWQDMQKKLEEYFHIGVGQVWVVEPANRAVSVYCSVTEIERLGDGDTLRGEHALAGFEMPVADLFAD